MIVWLLVWLLHSPAQVSHGHRFAYASLQGNNFHLSNNKPLVTNFLSLVSSLHSASHCAIDAWPAFLPVAFRRVPQVPRRGPIGYPLNRVLPAFSCCAETPGLDCTRDEQPHLHCNQNKRVRDAFRTFQISTQMVKMDGRPAHISSCRQAVLSSPSQPSRYCLGWQTR